MKTVASVLLAFAMTLPVCVVAHEVRPAYLSLTEVAADQFAVSWRVPTRGAMRLGLAAQLPVHCEATDRPRAYETPGAITEDWQVSCDGGLAGGTIAIDGLAAMLTDVLVRIDYLDGASQVVRLTPDSASFEIGEMPSRWQIARTYIGLGIEHILFGIDHLLFVLALLFLVDGLRRLVWTITAFTIAHSITLILASLGVLWVPGAAVEAVIALSIVFVAGEIVHVRQGHSSLTRRWPWLVAFLFGLLHGLGFAGALREIGLPEQSIVLALLCFNIGVEIGQLMFVAVAVVVIHAVRRIPLPTAEWLARTPAYVIGSVAAMWTIERVMAVL
jgi:hypothetical protein